MSISNVFVTNEIPTGADEPNGIIYNIRKNVTDTNILNYIVPTANVSTLNGNIQTIVKWDSYWQSEDNNKEAFLQIEFKTRFVVPTHYSLKGKLGYAYSKEWYLYGYNTLNEEPTLLSTDTSVGSTYCGNTNDDTNTCRNDNWGTFPIKYKVNKGFKYFGIRIKKPNNPSYWRIAMRGFEVFGTLSIYQSISSIRTKRTYCFKSYPLNNHLPTYAFLRMFSVYLS